MDTRHGSLLDMAMNSLIINSTTQKRQKIFESNQQAIENIRNITGHTAENLQIKPNINGEAELQAVQPVKFSESFEIELSKISLPAQCGAGTLRDQIQRSCNEYDIQFDANIDTATYTSVVTALAGQHAETDVDCAGVTKAEFVPVFNSRNTEKRALVLCYSLNGETKLRVDHLKVNYTKDNITCLGRQSKSPSALQAIEIPNLLAAEIQEDNPEMFTQLQKNACLIAFVEYDLIQPQHYYPAGTRTLGTRQGPLMRGGTMDFTRGSGEGFLSSGGSQGASLYSIIGQGSQAQDHSISISENGQKKLTKIHVYVVGAMVVNTNGKTLVPAQCNNIANLMQARANELTTFYSPFKIYRLPNFLAEVNSYLQKYNVNTAHSDILEHAILRLGSIDEFPLKCFTNPCQRTPQYFFIECELPMATKVQWVNNLQTKFGKEFCDHTSEYRPGTFMSMQAIRFSLELISKNFASLKSAVDEILSDPRNVLAYQKYSRQETPGYDNVVRGLLAITHVFGINSKSDCVEVVLLNMFSCKEELHKARVKPGNTYVAAMLDTHFFFDISENAAKQLVANINQTFPNQARFLCANTKLADKGEVLLCQISITNELLGSQDFRSMFEATLYNLDENNPLLIEKLRIQSGTQKKTSKDWAVELMPMASSYNRMEEGVAKQKLGEALLDFTAIIASPENKKSARFAASDRVRQALAFFESKQTATEYAVFKNKDKKLIKETQKALGLRK